MRTTKQSPSSRGRGLKYPQTVPKPTVTESPSSRGRGLKCFKGRPVPYSVGVALFTRAWIEIDLRLTSTLKKSSPSSRGRGLKYCNDFAPVRSGKVALFTRAWIEIPKIKKKYGGYMVALFTRAWIEIDYTGCFCNCCTSRPLHEGVD